MSTIRVDMAMSLDGFVAGPDDGPDEPMGVGGFRLFDWLDLKDGPGPSADVYADHLATRALISGRRTYELAGHWNGDHHDGVPIFVLTHDVPAEPPPGTVRFVTDATECAGLAREAVGDGVAAVHGTGATQSLLAAGEVDEILVHLVPVLLGGGRRLFDVLPEQVELELVQEVPVLEVEDRHRVLHLRYRVRS